MGAKRGAWVTWRSYTPEKRQTAHVSASDLRNGKVQAVRRLEVPIEVRVVDGAEDQVLVQLRRQP